MGRSVSAEDGHPGGAERWLSIHDELLRAMAHAVSNRLATISAVASLLEAGGTADARLLEGLRTEAERLEGLLPPLRQLPRREEAGLEPLLITDALDGAQRLVAEHPQMHGRAVAVVATGDVLPVWAEPTAVVHAACVALLAVARRGAGDLEVGLETVGDEVRLTVRARGAGGSAEGWGEAAAFTPDARAIDWLLAGSAGRAIVSADHCALALPTLPASRRRG